MAKHASDGALVYDEHGGVSWLEPALRSPGQHDRNGVPVGVEEVQASFGAGTPDGHEPGYESDDQIVD